MVQVWVCVGGSSFITAVAPLVESTRVLWYTPGKFFFSLGDFNLKLSGKEVRFTRVCV